jgi:hypothetical protein
MALAIVLGLLTFPVAIIIGFMTCIAGDAMTTRYTEATWVAGVVVGIAAFATMAYLTVGAVLRSAK